MKFTKMHGAGNDFIIVDNRSECVPADKMGETAKALCPRRTAVGADGIMFLDAHSGDDADVDMHFFNADGSEGEMCGNGARCLARYGVEHGLAEDAENIRILATAGLVKARRITEEQYEVRLNDPSVIDLHRKVFAAGKEYDCAYIELGNPGIPHAVVEVSAAELEKKENVQAYLKNASEE